MTTNPALGTDEDKENGKDSLITHGGLMHNLQITFCYFYICYHLRARIFHTRLSRAMESAQKPSNLIVLSLHVIRYSVTVLHFGFHNMNFDSSYWIQNPISVDSEFQKVCFPGFQILRSEFRIPKSSILDSGIIINIG